VSGICSETRAGIAPVGVLVEGQARGSRSRRAAGDLPAPAAFSVAAGSGDRGAGVRAAAGASAVGCRRIAFEVAVTYTGTNVSDATGNTFHATPDPISSGPIHLLIG
jgi:hypothetical protein